MTEKSAKSGDTNKRCCDFDWDYYNRLYAWVCDRDIHDHKGGCDDRSEFHRY